MFYIMNFWIIKESLSSVCQLCSKHWSTNFSFMLNKKKCWHSKRLLNLYSIAFFQHFQSCSTVHTGTQLFRIKSVIQSLTLFIIISQALVLLFRNKWDLCSSKHRNNRLIKKKTNIKKNHGRINPYTNALI